MDSIPPGSYELIRMLDKQIPDQCARLDQSDREIFFAAGQRSIVTALLQTMDTGDEEKSQNNKVSVSLGGTDE